MKVMFRPNAVVESDVDDPALRDNERQKGSNDDDLCELIEQGCPSASSTSTTSSSSSSSSSSCSLDSTEETLLEETLPEETLTDIEAAKNNLKELLLKHDRSVKHPEVEKAVLALVALNPTKDAASSPHLEGCFVSLTRAAFPGRLKQDKENDHIDQYTLGRMSFNIFQPNDLVCTITTTRNIVKRSPQEERAGSSSSNSSSSSSGRTFSYPLETHMIVHTPKGDFPASLQMEAFCSSADQPKNRLGVTFVGGTMVPDIQVRSDSTKLALWKEVFAHAYQKAAEERSYLSSMLHYVFKWMFQLTTPTDAEAQQNDDSSVHFEMKRCPHGHIEVLYLDQDMRITKGNRGTIVIVERSEW